MYSTYVHVGVYSIYVHVVCTVHMYMLVCTVHMYMLVCTVHMYMLVCTVHMYMLVCTVHMYIPQNLGKTAISRLDMLSHDINKSCSWDKMSDQRAKMSASCSSAQKMSDDPLILILQHCIICLDKKYSRSFHTI